MLIVDCTLHDDIMLQILPSDTPSNSIAYSNAPKNINLFAVLTQPIT